MRAWMWSASVYGSQEKDSLLTDFRSIDQLTPWAWLARRGFQDSPDTFGGSVIVVVRVHRQELDYDIFAAWDNAYAIAKGATAVYGGSISIEGPLGHLTMVASLPIYTRTRSSWPSCNCCNAIDSSLLEK